MSFADREESIRAHFAYWSRTGPGRYTVAVFAVAVATALEFGLYLIGPFHQSFILFYPTVVLVTMFGGFGPGVLATSLSAISAGYFFVEPRYTFTIRTPEDMVGPVLFTIIGLFLTFLTGRSKAASQALKRNESDLKSAQAVAHIGSWRHEIREKTLVLSDEACHIMGLVPGTTVTPERIMRENLRPEDRERIPREWAEAVSNGSYDTEERILVNGWTRWVHIRASIERDDRGQALAAVGTIQDITESKQADERLQEYEKALEGLQEMILVVDREYRYVIANQAFLRGRCIEREQLIGRHLAEIMGAEHFETTVKRRLDECFQGRVVNYEKRYTYPALGERDFSVSYFPVAGREGVERVAVVMQDVTEKRQADNSLRLFRALMDQSNDAVEIVDPETLRFLDVNETACRERGYTREEMLSMTVFDIAPDVDEEYRLRVLAKVREAGRAIFQVFHRRKDGSRFPVEISLTCVHVDRDYIIAVGRDISERKQAECALRESEDRYRDLVEHSEDLLCTHDLEGNLLSVNPAPARILGYSVEELLKIPMRDLIVPEGRELFEAYLERLRTTGKPESGVMCVIARSGEIRTWEYYNTLRTEGVEEPIVRGMAHDITEQRRVQNLLEKTESQFRVLVESSPTAMVISQGEEEKVEYYNPRFTELFGYTREDAPDVAQWWPLAYPDEAYRREVSELWSERVKEAISGDGKTGPIAARVTCKDGTHRDVEFSLVRAGEKNLVFGADFTAQKAAAEALRQNEERFRFALKDSPVTVFNQDRDLRYTWIYNPPPDWPAEAVGKTCDDVLGGKNAAVVNELERRVLETGEGTRAELTLGRNGNKRAFEVSLEPMRDSTGVIVGIRGSFMDVARLRQLADRLEEQRDRLVREKSYLEGEIQAELGFEEIIGHSPALLDVLRSARIVAPTDSTVLLLGETGTGKELVARALHSLSGRHEKSFIKLNCAAVPSGLLESELFGHERGAFTSAVSQKVGRLELADGGTLFLDEIGELPQELQPKLLRVLQDREFERLGGVRTLRVDVRIISATNRDLHKDVGEKRFREDLFYRLNVFPIHLPTLRERKSDIPMLVYHFIRKYGSRMGKHIENVPRETMSVLENWHWPGNVRELENMIERMVILSQGDTLAPPPVELDPSEFAEDGLEEMERDHILRVLRETHGVLSGVDGAATRLGMKRTTLQSMLKRFGIEPGDFRRIGGMAETK